MIVPEYFSVFAVAVIVSTLNIIHVIVGAAAAPPGTHYLGIGHYYLDYLEYLSQIARGMGGEWMGKYFHYWPYIIIGKFAWLFRLSAPVAYWSAIFLLTAVFVYLMYLVIKKMLADEPLYVRLTALLIAVFASPLGPADDFWYGPSNFFRRFGGVPYHLLAVVMALAVILLVARIFQQIERQSPGQVAKSAAIVGAIIILIMTFSPISTITLLLTIGLATAVYGIKTIITKKLPSQLVVFSIVMSLLVLPAAIIIKRSYYFPNFGNMEVAWMQRPPWWFIVSNIGAVFFLFPFGLKRFLMKISPLKLLIIFYVLSSYALFFSDMARYLQTHNLRFFTGINYILFGALAASGIKAINNFLSKKQFIFIILTVILLVLFGRVNWSFYQALRETMQSYAPVNYLPQGVVDGYRYLDSRPDKKTVLAEPEYLVGTILPAFSGKPVYVNNITPIEIFIKKAAIVDRFYRGEMDRAEAEAFLRNNNIGYVVLTSLDWQSPTILGGGYSFLKPVYQNHDIIIYR